MTGLIPRRACWMNSDCIQASLAADCAGFGLETHVPVLWEQFEKHYNEPHRRYHTLEHVAAMLEEVPDPPDNIMRLAIWFHDVVYDPRRPDNEQASANLVGTWIPDLEMEGRQEIENLVLATDHRLDTPTAPAACRIRDIDLLILSASPEDYERYAEAIRFEYSHVPDGITAWDALRC